MCLDCGCDEPENDHGDQRHITHEVLVQAAAASNIDPKQAAKNIVRTLKHARKAADRNKAAEPGA